MDGPSLYETDILAWSEEQAAALRALGGRRDLPNALDLEHVAEEIEGLGRMEFRAATSPIRLILEHLLKAACDPDSPARAHWRREVVVWHGDILDTLTPSMHRRVDMEALWRRARRDAQAALEEHGSSLPPGVPAACPLDLTDFLGEEFDFEAGVTRIRAAIRP